MKYKLYTLDNQFIEEANKYPPKFTGIAEYYNGTNQCFVTKHWFVEGKRHRLDGPACEYDDGTKQWWVKGKLHRFDGPAYVGADGKKAWWVDGKRHKLDGPATEWADGTKEWYINDKQVTEEQHNLLHSIMRLKGLI